MKGFLFGLGMGIGLGILFAPMSGEETRNNLADRANDLASSARDTMNRDATKSIAASSRFAAPRNAPWARYDPALTRECAPPVPRAAHPALAEFRWLGRNQ